MFQVSSFKLVIMSVRFNAKPGPHCRCSAQAAAQSTVPPVAPAAWSCGALLVLVLDRDSDVQYRGPLSDSDGSPGVRGARPRRDSEEVRGPHSHLRPTSRELRLEEAKQKVFKRLNLRASGHEF